MIPLLLAIALSAEPEIVRTMHDAIPVAGTHLDSRLPTFDAAQADESVDIPAGETVTVTAPETCLNAVWRGTLRLEGAGLTVQTAMGVGLDSSLHIVADHPEPRDYIVFRDRPLDVVNDPHQYHNGLIVIDGRVTIETPYWRQAWATLAEEVRAGDQIIKLTATPHGWLPGDKLVLPDTRTPGNSEQVAAHTETAEILHCCGETIILSAPVQFDHLGWRDSADVVRVLPDVGCMTQPVVFRSENPNGVRGHCLFTRYADVDVQGVALKELGRTTTAPLHSTLVDAQGGIQQIGTNQIGRYAWHFHHLLGRQP